MNGNIRMISFICEERRYTCSSVRCIVVGEFRERKQFRPIVLLIVAVDADVLFQGLVGALCLTVGLGMITGSEVKLHVKCCPKGSEEAGNEFDPRSEVTWEGTPCLEKTWRTNSLA